MYIAYIMYYGLSITCLKRTFTLEVENHVKVNVNRLH